MTSERWRGGARAGAGAAAQAEEGEAEAQLQGWGAASPPLPEAGAGAEATATAATASGATASGAVERPEAAAGAATGTPPAAGAPGAADPDARQWFYLDPCGRTQGPCTIANFHVWLRRLRADAALRTEYHQFLGVAVWRVSTLPPSTPFTHTSCTLAFTHIVLLLQI